MTVWVYRLLDDLVMQVTVSNIDDLTPEEFAAEFQAYFPEDIYFFAELIPLS